MLRRLAFVLACCTSPAFAQTNALPLTVTAPEPPVQVGEVAVRMRNDTDCLIGLRAKADGVIVGYARLEAHGTLWLHLRPDTSALAVEVLASPKYCPRRDTSAVAPSRALLRWPTRTALSPRRT